LFQCSSTKKEEGEEEEVEEKQEEYLTPIKAAQIITMTGRTCQRQVEACTKELIENLHKVTSKIRRKIDKPKNPHGKNLFANLFAN